MPTAFEVIKTMSFRLSKTWFMINKIGDILGIDSDRAVQGVKNIPYP